MPFKSQAQRGLIAAIAEGRVQRPGLSKATAKKMMEDDPGGKLPKKAKKPNSRK